MRKPKSTKRLKPVKREGTALRPGVYPGYPKRYELSITPDEDGQLMLSRINTGFSAYELYGHLRMILLDIERQLTITPTAETELLEKAGKEQ